MRLTFNPIGALERLHLQLARAFDWFAPKAWSVAARIPLRLKLSAGFLLLSALCWCLAATLPDGYFRYAAFDAAQLRLLEQTGAAAMGRSVAWIGRMGCILSLLAGVMLWLPRRWSFRAMEAALAWGWLTLLAALRFGFAAPGGLCRADYRLFDTLSRDALWTVALGASVGPLLLLGLLTLGLSLGPVRRRYGLAKGEAIGDRFLRSVRTGGPDPRFRSSLIYSASLFLAVLIAPFILRGCSWEEPYGLVQGAGEPQMQVVRIKKVKKEKRKKFILNKWSPYILERAKLEDVKTLDQLLEDTQDTYVADQQAKSGKLGKGGGKQGGWPKGMADAKVRFIRLRYAGGDWDQDMGKGSDYNLLLRLREMTGFPIWHETESRPVSALARFPKDHAPPFVFLTGSRGISLSNSEIAVLRRYLTEEAGLLFIDNGGGHFGQSVRQLVTRLFPDRPFIDIPNDDPIFRQPFVFPDGAPPLWHHDGTRAKGIRIGERLAVFYHPGDINDAWKDGHSGVSPAIAEQAYRLGVNVIYYAFNAYHARHFEGQKDTPAAGK